MNELTVNQLLSIIGDLRVQLFDADSNLLLADGQKTADEIQKYEDHIIDFIYFRRPNRICIRNYKEDLK